MRAQHEVRVLVEYHSAQPIRVTATRDQDVVDELAGHKSAADRSEARLYVVNEQAGRYHQDIGRYSAGIGVTRHDLCEHTVDLRDQRWYSTRGYFVVSDECVSRRGVRLEALDVRLAPKRRHREQSRQRGHHLP